MSHPTSRRPTRPSPASSPPCEARLAREGLRVAPEHRFVDEGYSGATLVRPALERLRDAAAAGALDRVYVHAPDRLARRYAYQVLLVDELRRAGVEIVFLNRAIGLSPEDDLLLQVQGMVAEYERAKILERSRRGKRHAAREGAVSVLSGAPYGYRYIGKRDGGGCARYQVDEEEARIVRLIFGWVGRDRVSIGEVCRRLQAQGYPTRGGKRAWDRTTVWGILKNPAYAGAAAFGKTRVGPRPVRLRPVRGGSEQPRRAYGVHDVPPAEWLRVPVPALVDGGLFEAVREQLEENRRRNRQGARGQRYLLQGLLVCRRCGYAYYGKAISSPAAKGKPRAYAYYRCCGSDAHRFGGQRVCSNAQVRTDRLDAAVWHEVERLLRDPARIATEYERRLDEARQRGSDGPELDVVEAQIAKLRRAMARLIDGYADGLIDKAEFEPRITGLRQRIEGWEEQAASLRDEAALRRTLSLIIGRLEDFAQRVRGRMAEVDWSLQRDLIRTLVKRVEIDHDGINVVFRVAPSPSDSGPPDPDGKRTWQGCGWSGDRPLRGPRHRLDHPAVLEHARLQPLPEQADDPAVADPVLDEPDQPVVADRVEERPDVGVQHPVDPLPGDPGGERVQRVVLAAPGPEPVAEAEELRLVDRRQDGHHRGLDDLVLQRRDAERPSPAVRLRYVPSPGRQRPVGAAVEAVVEIGEPGLQVDRVLLPGQAIDSRRRVPSLLEEGPT